MKLYLFIYFTILCFGDLQSQVNSLQLAEKEGVTYKKGDTVPFTGKCTDWLDKTRKQSEREYVNGKVNGTEILWYDNGKIFSQAQYKDGKYNGVLTQYYENGNKQFEHSYIADYMNGTAIEWYQNGIKKSEGKYNDCHEDGLWIYYDENGKKTKEIEFQKGKIIKETNY